MEISVGTCGSVRYSVGVRYLECPLMESPLYTSTRFGQRVVTLLWTGRESTLKVTTVTEANEGVD